MTSIFSIYERNREFDFLADAPRRIAELKREIEKVEREMNDRKDRLMSQYPQAFTHVSELPLSPRVLKLCLESGYDYAYHLARLTQPKGFGKKTLDEISAALRSINMPRLVR